MAGLEAGRFAPAMQPEHRYAANWRDAAAYASLLQADRSIFAWEWLRRNPGYRSAAARARERSRDGPCDAARWGLHAFEAPHLGAPLARPLWRAEVHPYVLAARAEPTARACDSLDLGGLQALASLVVAADGRQHLLISDGLRAIRVDLLSGSLGEGPVCLHYGLAGFDNAERPLLTLRRLLALRRTGRFSAGLHPPWARAGRLVLMLRALDALAAGATQREIAVELLSAEAAEAQWRVSAPTVRSRVQRLVRAARAMAAGGYVSLLKT